MTYGIDIAQLRSEIVRPVLTYLGMWSPSAENLVVGTALMESRGEYLRQLGAGPARGLWQMEPATHDDVLNNYVAGRPILKATLATLMTSAGITSGADELIGNLYYACAMCRIHYMRVKQPLPDASNSYGMAMYWKEHYNTPQGAGTVDAALPHFQAACS